MSAEECREIVNNQNKYRKEIMGCDVIFKIGEKAFPAHRLILKMRSEFFAKMFSPGMKENIEPVIKLDPTIVSSDVFDEVLNYIYTSDFNLTEKNAVPICIAADFLQERGLIQKTKDFLVGNMKMTNVSSYFEMALRINFVALKKKCLNFIVENSCFKALRHDLISWFSAESLEMILEELKHYSKPEESFYFAVEWVEDAEAERIPELAEFLQRIQISSLRLKFLQEVVAEREIVMKNLECLKLFMNAFKQASHHDLI